MIEWDFEDDRYDHSFLVVVTLLADFCWVVMILFANQALCQPTPSNTSYREGQKERTSVKTKEEDNDDDGQSNIDCAVIKTHQDADAGGMNNGGRMQFNSTTGLPSEPGSTVPSGVQIQQKEGEGEEEDYRAGPGSDDRHDEIEMQPASNMGSRLASSRDDSGEKNTNNQNNVDMDRIVTQTNSAMNSSDAAQVTTHPPFSLQEDTNNENNNHIININHQ